jgi:hypothetical protein
MAGTIISDLIGTGQPLFQLNGANQIKTVAGGIQHRNAADDADVKAYAAPSTGAAANELVTWQNQRNASPDIAFAFDGASPPAAGTNTGKHGMCHTTGGAYNAGEIYYDSGTALEIVTVFIGLKVTTDVAVGGTVGLTAGTLYVATSAAAPYGWESRDTGGSPDILLTPSLTSDTSSASLTEGTEVYEIVVKIPAGSGYDNAAALTVRTDAANPVNDLQLYVFSATEISQGDRVVKANPYVTVSALQAGPVVAELSNSPTVGSCFVTVRRTVTKVE